MSGDELLSVHTKNSKEKRKIGKKCRIECDGREISECDRETSGKWLGEKMMLAG